ncbi:MAG: MerR family transcriptional regulator [Clostridiales bacterium]|nr:MerR family transcriptional regulator [Clostridiales bacterium]
MSKYTTGELAKRCGVTVRTVQYYDTRGILSPSELSEGGRRLYTQKDLDKLRIICFLRELGLSIDAISQLLSEEDPGSVITLLLSQQEEQLKKEIADRQVQLDKLAGLRHGLKAAEPFSVESIGDIAYTMTNRKDLKRIHMNLLLTGLPVTLLQLGSIALWALTGKWQLFAVWAAVAVVYGVVGSRYYFEHVAYICPKCHTVFRPGFKEAFFARHTPSARRLTCTACGHHGFCVEVAPEKGEAE